MIFVIYFEGIVEITIVSIFNFKLSYMNSLGEFLGTSQSYFSLIMIFSVMPLISIFLFIARTYYKDKFEFNNKKFKNIFGVFYKGFRKNSLGLNYQIIYLIKRMIFVLLS